MDQNTQTLTLLSLATYILPAAKAPSLINIDRAMPLRAISFSLDNLQLSAMKEG